MKYLEENGLMGNTMIVYTSDQGFYMGEHGWFDKRFMYEESFRTPLIVRLPGGKKGDIDEMVQNIDYGPTILDLAGVKVPSDMHGVSFLPLLKGEKVSDCVSHCIIIFMNIRLNMLSAVIMVYVQIVIN